MKILRLSKDLVLAFGLQWEQHDALSGSEHQAIRAWRAKGLRESARYNLPGGRVYGLVPANGSHDEKATSYKGMLAGAAVLATHPELRDATGMVFFEIREGDHLRPRGGRKISNHDHIWRRRRSPARERECPMRSHPQIDEIPSANR